MVRQLEEVMLDAPDAVSEKGFFSRGGTLRDGQLFPALRQTAAAGGVCRGRQPEREGDEPQASQQRRPRTRAML
ncbi:hypothetical protein BE20_12895 [Sorangium cellulosum]|uniref:Uncharacterized protein n=1 Tax=Sorangium cellulosum TaxID=56 RepID=A0A150SDQ1_SORCE|nr:hypothetical protein BE18_11510 [Sorangium cellulosum]KYF92091.1 hypothetical protein BE20_12895 [Sorangium cellulosum]